MGLAAARRLVAEGARVFVVGRDEEKLAAALAGLGDTASGCPCDVAVEAQVEAAFDQALDFLGRLDATFVNAGVDGQNRGYVRTPQVEPYLDDPEIAAEIVSRIPLGRVGDADEIAALVSYLIRPEAAYMNGSVIPIDGGRMA
jgi:NAD(P)-dependent dehydrogenase (short-subunit alcohol dehydrogenase family)